MKCKGKTTISSTSKQLKQLAKHSWFNNLNIKTKDKNFKTFQIEMDKLAEGGLLLSDATIGRFHNRLLIEDLMGVVIGTELVLLIHQSHHSYVSSTNETWWSTR